MLFAHYGADVLFTIKNTDFTLEALIYGLNQGVVFAGVMLWFSALSYNADGDRVLYLFSFAPKLALIFSIILGFIPRFNKKLKDISDARKALGGGESPAGLKEKYNTALNNLSALITYSLESSIITADSMNARGYKQGALSVKRYRLCVQDIVLLFAVLMCFGVDFCYKATGGITFIFDPVIRIESFSITALILFVFVQMIPFFVEMWEDMLWKLSNARA
jgi:energy-coupling factor transport system permease protein